MTAKKIACNSEYLTYENLDCIKYAQEERRDVLKFLIGGSPCTHWSIAQGKNRETNASGVGWELFKNFLIAKEKFKPDYFLYENNHSISKAIKDQITKELGVDLIMINSALVSAQSRKRCYWTNIPDIEQPEDRGILLQDILCDGVSWKDKSYALTTRCGNAVAYDTLKKHRHTMVAIPIRIGTIENVSRNPNRDSKQYRVYSPEGKATTLCANGGGIGAKTGLYAVPLKESNYEICDGATIYAVKDKQIEIKGEMYPIKLSDGYYIIRKLTIPECCRLQTLPDDYCRVVSNAQAYKGLGNGWTAEVIIHILSYALSSVPRDEEFHVLSMYDGIGTGRHCFDKLGFHNIKYFSYEIDKYAMQISQSNYPDIIQCGDAFQVREDDWIERFRFVERKGDHYFNERARSKTREAI